MQVVAMVSQGVHGPRLILLRVTCENLVTATVAEAAGVRLYRGSCRLRHRLHCRHRCCLCYYQLHLHLLRQL